MTKRWRAWFGALGSLLMVPVVVLVATGPAHACSCAMGKTADYVEWADAVFTGSVVDVDEAEPDDDGIVSSADDVTMVVAVDEVFKGEAAAQVEVLTASGGASCGISPAPEREDSWLWFVYLNDAGAFAANICGGSGPANEKSVAGVVDLAGPGRTPTGAPQSDDEADPGSEAGAGDSEGPAPDSESRETGADDERGSSAVPWGVGGIALVLGAALGGVVVVRRRARGARTVSDPLS